MYELVNQAVPVMLTGFLPPLFLTCLYKEYKEGPYLTAEPAVTKTAKTPIRSHLTNHPRPYGGKGMVEQWGFCVVRTNNINQFALQGHQYTRCVQNLTVVRYSREMIFAR